MKLCQINGTEICPTPANGPKFSFFLPINISVV